MAVTASLVIPTYDRPGMLATAVDSALAQTFDDYEVVVVDDGSPQPVSLPAHPRLRVVRMDGNRGGSAARNRGLAEAHGRWITYLDDDDVLLPNHLEAALDALADSDLPPPVATLSGIEIVTADGAHVETRLPPTLPRGAAFSLEEPPPGRSFSTKATLVVETEVLAAIGGFDESFRSRVHTELFLRLNPVCSLLGLPFATYQRRKHEGPRVSDDPFTRADSLRRLEAKHRDAFAAHPARYAEMVFHQAFRLWLSGRRGPALATWARAMRLHPPRAARRTATALGDRYRYARQRAAAGPPGS